jgi:hypothetical protein
MRELRGSSIDVKSMHDDEFARREKKRIKSAREGGRVWRAVNVVRNVAS